jgi:Flp pilus assembly protein TadG
MRLLLFRGIVDAGKPRPRGAWRGVAIVEFALVAPIFFLVVMGVIEIGRAIMVQQHLTNASREGARVAGKDSTMSASDVQSAVNNYLSGAGISGATTTVSPNVLSGVLDGEPVTVSVSVSYSQVSWVPSPWFFQDTTLGAATVMTRQPSP